MSSLLGMHLFPYFFSKLKSFSELLFVMSYAGVVCVRVGPRYSQRPTVSLA